jgi:hypothetical protein
MDWPEKLAAVRPPFFDKSSQKPTETNILSKTWFSE